MIHNTWTFILNHWITKSFQDFVRKLRFFKSWAHPVPLGWGFDIFTHNFLLNPNFTFFYACLSYFLLPIISLICSSIIWISQWVVSGISVKGLIFIGLTKPSLGQQWLPQGTIEENFVFLPHRICQWPSLPNLAIKLIRKKRSTSSVCYNCIHAFMLHL